MLLIVYLYISPKIEFLGTHPSSWEMTNHLPWTALSPFFRLPFHEKRKLRNIFPPWKDTIQRSMLNLSIIVVIYFGHCWKSKQRHVCLNKCELTLSRVLLTIFNSSAHYSINSDAIANLDSVETRTPQTQALFNVDKKFISIEIIINIWALESLALSRHPSYIWNQNC